MKLSHVLTIIFKSEFFAYFSLSLQTPNKREIAVKSFFLLLGIVKNSSNCLTPGCETMDYNTEILQHEE